MVMLQPQAQLKDYQAIASSLASTLTVTAIEQDSQVGISEDVNQLQHAGLLPLALLTVLLNEPSNSSISPWFTFHLCANSILCMTNWLNYSSKL